MTFATKIYCATIPPRVLVRLLSLHLPTQTTRVSFTYTDAGEVAVKCVGIAELSPTTEKMAQQEILAGCNTTQTLQTALIHSCGASELFASVSTVSSLKEVRGNEFVPHTCGDH